MTAQPGLEDHVEAHGGHEEHGHGAPGHDAPPSKADTIIKGIESLIDRFGYAQYIHDKTFDSELKAYEGKTIKEMLDSNELNTHLANIVSAYLKVEGITGEEAAKFHTDLTVTKYQLQQFYSGRLDTIVSSETLAVTKQRIAQNLQERFNQRIASPMQDLLPTPDLRKIVKYLVKKGGVDEQYTDKDIDETVQDFTTAQQIAFRAIGQIPGRLREKYTRAGSLKEAEAKYGGSAQYGAGHGADHGSGGGDHGGAGHHIN